MSEPAEVELLELPAEFRGRPYRSRVDAQNWAEASVPYERLAASFGAAVAEQVVVQAAAHYLAITGAGTGAPPALRYSATSTVWHGSPYGDNVAATLLQLPRASGRGRQLPIAV